MDKANKTTDLGQLYLANSTEFIQRNAETLRGKVNLILTSPPFPLNRKKQYGNRTGGEYREWFQELAPLYSSLLTDDGSIVIEMGNSWIPGRPIQSTLHLECLLAFVHHPDANLRLCQEFISYNPARLPSPAEWVTKRRCRLTDSYTHVWWIAKQDMPKADNRNVLRSYSESMRALLKSGRYNSGKRPSGHNIGETSFLKDNQGSIPPNFFEIDPFDEDHPPRLPNAFSWANTAATDAFLNKLRKMGLEPHPARMHPGLARFFIEFLTTPNDLVMDPFAGSGTTLVEAESAERRWLGIDIEPAYLAQSVLRLETLEPTRNTDKEACSE